MKHSKAIFLIVLFLINNLYNIHSLSVNIKKSLNSKQYKRQEESYDYTLPEINIDNNHKIEYYYPYFYKTHIIEYNDNINYQQLTNDCPDYGCEWCNGNNKYICSECRHGFFLFQDKCYTVCPDNYSADIFKKKCSPLQTSNSLEKIVYLKAFTTGSCKNLCGATSIDCSCNSSCVSQGNCCSDYYECENLLVNNKNRQIECQQRIDNCELCNFSNDPNAQPTCGLCKANYFLRNGKCTESCFPSDKLSMTNRLCIKNQDCRVENCSECVENNPAVCKQCNNGFFMYNNQCLISCPLKYRADRISWVCLEAPVFAWYWVFPSRTTCMRKCGAVVSQDMDCSCSEDCFRLGNCCQDIEDYCPEFVFWK